MQELVTRGICRLLDISGKENPADSLTKHIDPKSVFRGYMGQLYQATASLFHISHTGGKAPTE